MLPFEPFAQPVPHDPVPHDPVPQPLLTPHGNTLAVGPFFHAAL
jgi:hypothetical protein